MKVGKTVNVIIAKVAPQFLAPMKPTKSFRPRVTVFIFVLFVNVYALIKSFQANTVCIVAIVKIEFLEIGTTILTKHCMGEHPSIIAASKRSFGKNL